MTYGQFQITRVVSKNLVVDAFQWVRNLFGFRLRSWEKHINNSIADLCQEMRLKYDPKWWRLIVNPLTDGSAMLIVYGEGTTR